MHVLFHDNCFDGAASAAVFASFYRACIRPGAAISYQGLSHQAGGAPIPAAAFQGEENAIVDFRYSQSPRLTWWFDHHASGFQHPGDEEHFRADGSGRKFHDPTRKSCTKFIADVTRERFGFDPSPLAELIEWAELIDGAQFPSPEMAVGLREPALQLMTVLEANHDPALIPEVIRRLQEGSLSEVAALPIVQGAFRPLLARHRAAVELVKRKARIDQGIVFFDVADEGLDGINKFIAYELFPEARYVVWVGKNAKRTKVSIGSNPWRPELRRHDLSAIAERYGGGGHPVVAAMSFHPEEVARARAAAAEIVAELRTARAVD
ncbi:MAG TPA: DHHA1 domain-containing protein [Myxococcaceae bacterium]|nr:DHHA1 domain-containing protein [Myxococcaceae bacterium]